MNASHEISLRDLYMLLKRGLPVILGLTVALGAAALIISFLLPPIYEAESTTVITPPPVNLQSQEGISFIPSVNVAYEAYKTFALSRSVMEATLAQFPNLDVTARELRHAVRLEKLVGPQRPEQSGPLSVSHRVRHADAEMSAALSKIWAEVTLETIRNSLLAGLDPVDTATGSEAAALKINLESAEDRWRAFQEEDESQLLEARLDMLTSQITSGEARLGELARALDVASARRETLQEQLQAELIRTTSSDPTSDTFLAGLSLKEANRYLGAQLEMAEKELGEARQAFDAFDQEHNLALYGARVERLTAEVADKERQLASVSGEIEIAGATLASLEGQRANEPRLLTLTESILSDPILSEAARSAGELEVFLGLKLEGEQLNPNHTQILSGMMAQRSELARLEARKGVLEAEILQSREELQEERSKLIALAAERRPLEIALSQAEGYFQGIRSRSIQLSLSDLDPRESERILRDTTPEVLSLQSDLRGEEVHVRSLQVERESLENQLESLAAEAERARQRLALLNQQKSRLALDLENAKTAYQDVVRLQPTLSYVTQLAPLSARVLSEAAVPDVPVAPRKLFNTALALVLGIMLSTLYLFLRELLISSQAPLGYPVQDVPLAGDD